MSNPKWNDEIPYIEMQIVSTPVKRRACAICHVADHRPLHFAGMPRPWWVIGNRSFGVWSGWMRWVRRKRTDLSCHDECLPEGWSWWKIEQSQDIVAYHSIDAEKELMKALVDEVERTRNDGS